MHPLVTITDFQQLGLFEYLFVAHPDSSVNEKIVAEKRFFYSEYKQKVAIKTQPHITVANFLARERMEETIIRYMQRIASRQASFEVALNNYSGFPTSNTIYLRIQNPHPFRQLAKELKAVANYVRSCSCPPVQVISNPHLTIARRLPETVYSRAIMDYSHKTFHETFSVSQLVLLRRKNQYDTCTTLQVFPLPQQGQNPPTLFD